MEKETEKQNLGSGSIPGLMIKLAVPTIIAQLVNLLYNLVDRIYIGHIREVGDIALTGLGLCFPVLMMVTAFAMLIGSGGAPRAAIYMGKGDNETAERILGNSVTSLIVISVVLTIFLEAVAEPILWMFGASEKTLPFALGYMRIYVAGSIFVMMTLGLNMFITTQGFAKISMMTTIIGAVINIILDPIFIFALGMGVKGAALATIISQAVSCGWVLAFLTGKKTFLRIKKEYLKPVPSIVFPCLALGLSTFVMQSSESVISVCFNSSLLKYGGDLAVGAMTILTSTMQFAMLPLQGIGQGAQPIMSYNYGARNIDRMKKTFKLHLVISLIYSTLFWLFVQLFPATFAGIFSSDPELVSFTAGALRIYCGAMFLFGIQLACQMTFVAIGYAVCSIIVAVVRKFVLLLPLIFIVPMFVSNKTMGIYMAEPIADAIAVTFTAILFSIQFKKALKKLDKA